MSFNPTQLRFFLFWKEGVIQTEPDLPQEKMRAAHFTIHNTSAQDIKEITLYVSASSAQTLAVDFLNDCNVAWDLLQARTAENKATALTTIEVRTIKLVNLPAHSQKTLILAVPDQDFIYKAPFMFDGTLSTGEPFRFEAPLVSGYAYQDITHEKEVPHYDPKHPNLFTYLPTRPKKACGAQPRTAPSSV